MKSIDQIISARWIIPVEPDGVVYEKHSIAIHEGKILDLLPAAEAARKFDADLVLNLESHALIPGFVNAHTHAAMSLLRGLADDLPLMEWLHEHIWPAEQKWVSEEFIHDGSQLAIAEMLRSGTTCFNDMYFFPEVTARCAAACGIRASVGLILIDFPTAYAGDSDDYIAKGLALHDQYRNHPLISTAFAPHAPYSVSDEPLERVRVLADELEIPVHIHVHETADEVQRSLESHGQRPLARLDGLGLVSPSLSAVHMTQLEDAEIERIAQTGARIIHCPESNMKLASGYCPVGTLENADITVAIGTDGAASNNDLDMLGELRTAALLAKSVSADASALPARTALRMATLNGAMALGIASNTGSLEKGKWADLCAIQLDGIESEPVYHPISQIVYATTRHQVTDVWVGGQHLLKDRALTTLDTDEIIGRAREWRSRILS